VSAKTNEFEKRALVTRTVSAALVKRTGEHMSFSVEDSLGIRTFYAAFQRHIIDEIIATECAAWDRVNVRALSSGYSGASVLAVRGYLNNAHRQIVIKIAPRRELIEWESKIHQRFAGESPIFMQSCAITSDVKSLSDCPGFYSVQDGINGDTISSIVDGKIELTKDASLLWKTAIDGVLHIELPHYGNAFSKNNASQLQLLEVDCQRAEKSCSELSEMADVLLENNDWLDQWPRPIELFSRIREFVQSWNERLKNESSLQWVLQHGDLNPNNIILNDAGSITFIDLARLDHWPVGYDLMRLCIQLRIRNTGNKKRADWVKNDIAVWCTEPLFSPDQSRDFASLCPPAAYCESKLFEWINKQPNAECLIHGVRLCATKDLIRIISYTDLPPFKRLWASLELWNILQLL